MNHIYEKLKSVFLILFVCLSILQIGILWSYQNQGLPINFLSGAVARSNASDQEYQKGLLSPSRIVVSQGFDEPHIVFERDGISFSKTWQETRLYLRDTLIEPHIIASIDYSDYEWGNIVVKKAIVINFYSKIDTRLLYYLLGLENANEISFTHLYKMAIVFNESVINKMAMYITDGAKIYKYDIKPHQQGLNEENANFESIYAKSEIDFGYKLLREIFPRKEKAPWDFRPEIPVYILGEKFVDFNKTEVLMPEWMNISATQWNNLSNISKAILGVDKDSYDAGIDDKGNYISGNIDNIYRINKQGILEYTYLGENSEKIIPDIRASFEKAMDFINLRNDLIDLKSIDIGTGNENVSSKNSLKGNQNIYLSNEEYDSKNRKYIFDFNYSIGEVPVIFIDEPDGASTKAAIRVEVDSSRVVSCTMILRKLLVDGDSNMYNIGFKEFSSQLYKKFEKSGLKQLSMEDTFVGYSLDSTNTGLYEPSWIIRTSQGGFYSFPINHKKGD